MHFQYVSAEDERKLISNEQTSDYLSKIEIDTLGEIGNISFGSSATTLIYFIKSKSRDNDTKGKY